MKCLALCKPSNWKFTAIYCFTAALNESNSLTVLDKQKVER